jgi:hypothetical protein
MVNQITSLWMKLRVISGVSLALSMKNLVLNEEAVTFDVYVKVIRRALILFGLNMFLANGYSFATHWRIPGVLFYFSVSGLITSLTVLSMLKRTRARLTYIMENEHT